MNRDEEIAQSFLISNYSDVEYEPDGNIPPDFTIGASIGVEVRRLNQRYRDGKSTKGLEESSISLEKIIIRELNKNSTAAGNKFWLDLKYEREFGKPKEIKAGVQKFIQEFESIGEPCPFEYKIAHNVFIKVLSKANSPSQKFSFGAYFDQDSGGWVESMYVEEIQECLDEKAGKIHQYLNKYSNWWLLLVDHISCMSSHELARIKDGISINSCWQKLLIISVSGEVVLEI